MTTGGSGQGAFEIAGKVTGGLHRAGYFVSIPWVSGQIREKLGFTPYPGTLNIKVAGPLAAELKERARQEGVRLDPESGDFCAAYCLPVKICGQRGALVFPGAGGQEEDVLEVLGTVNFREHCGLTDGDKVTVGLTCV